MLSMARKMMMMMMGKIAVLSFQAPTAEICEKKIEKEKKYCKE